MKLSGKEIATTALHQLLEDRKTCSDQKCKIVVIAHLADNDASTRFITQVKKLAETLDIIVETYHIIPSIIGEEPNFYDRVKTNIKNWNQDPNIQGILLVRPLLVLGQEETQILSDLIDPRKNLDPITYISKAQVGVGLGCTQYAIVKTLHSICALEESKDPKSILLCGNGSVVRQLYEFFREYYPWYAITTCKQKELCKKFMPTADIIITALGDGEDRAQWFTEQDVLQGRSTTGNVPVVIDVGMHLVNGKLVGDFVEPEDPDNPNIIYTPVPGGLGPVTVYSVFGQLFSTYFFMSNLQTRMDDLNYL